MSWTELEFFNPAQAPPAGVNVVETGWPSGQPASAGWPNHPAGWRIVASSQAGRLGHLAEILTRRTQRLHMCPQG